MKLKTIYDLAVKKGLSEDQRQKKEIEAILNKTRREYQKLNERDKKAFDKEMLNHTYDDSRVLNGTAEEEIQTVMVGIDIDVSEILLADRLRAKGEKIDLVVSHHPSGRAYAQLHKVMAIQPSLWQAYGLSKEVSEGLMKDRMDEVARTVAPSNHFRAVDAARLLGIPFMCLHTTADNCVAGFLQKLFDARKPKKLKNVVDILKAIPEYKDGMCKGAGPFILIGEEKNVAGKIFVDMTGGTSGPESMFGRLSQSGVKTIIGMHCKESGYKVAKSEFINYVIAGHIASDNLGMNLLFDSIDEKGRLKFIECSGFKRVRRK